MGVLLQIPKIEWIYQPSLIVRWERGKDEQLCGLISTSFKKEVAISKKRGSNFSYGSVLLISSYLCRF